MFSIGAETPFKMQKTLPQFTINPKVQMIVTPGISNSNKISNEDSTNNNFTIQNIYRLNRFSGSDKMDNSKRVTYGVNAYTNHLKTSLSQYYEFTNNSNYHKEQQNDDKLSDLLGSVQYLKDNELSYNFRYDMNDSYLKQQSANFKTDNQYGEFNVSYLDQNSIVNNIITKDNETINYSFFSKKFLKFSKINLSGLYDLKEEINKEYSVGYSYFDECFGLNLDFDRKSYKEDNLKPQDILTIMFSFKNVGSYRSTNLAVSENDKQDIEWESYNINNEKFEKFE